MHKCDVYQSRQVEDLLELKKQKILRSVNVCLDQHKCFQKINTTPNYTSVLDDDTKPMLTHTQNYVKI